VKEQCESYRDGQRAMTLPVQLLQGSSQKFRASTYYLEYLKIIKWCGNLCRIDNETVSKLIMINHCVLWQSRASAFYRVVHWHKSHNFIVLDICVPKIIKFCGDLTEVLTKTSWIIFSAHPVCQTWIFQVRSLFVKSGFRKVKMRNYQQTSATSFYI